LSVTSAALKLATHLVDAGASKPSDESGNGMHNGPPGESGDDDRASDSYKRRDQIVREMPPRFGEST
jgi:hypothetical protein